MQTNPQRQQSRKPTHLRAVPCPAPKPMAPQDATPEQQAAWRRLHGYAGMPLPEPVESYLRADAAQLHRVDATQMQAAEQATVRHHAPDATQELDLEDLWPVIGRIYAGLALAGFLLIIAMARGGK